MNNMEELVNAIKVALADHYAFYFKAHGYHWNVECSDFEEYHALFGKIYEDIQRLKDKQLIKIGSYLSKNIQIKGVLDLYDSQRSIIGMLATALYEPWSGKITFDGKEFKEIPTQVFKDSIGLEL